MKTKILRVAALLLVLALGVVLPGCSKNKSPVTPAVASPFGEEILAELKVPADDWAFAAREKGWLTESFGQYGIKVTLVEGTTGNEAQLISRDDLHLAERMIYPYLLYRTQGANLTVVEVSAQPKSDITSILVLKDSPIQTFDDLKGKKLASWRASCTYISLYELAEQRNWVQGKDWTYINIPSGENKNTLLSKEIDAISTHISGDVAQLLIGDLAREVAHPSEDSVYMNGGGVRVIFASPEFANKYPKIIKEYIAVRRKTERWMLDNLDEAAKLIEGITRVPPDVSKIQWIRWGSAWKTSDLDKETIQKQVKNLQDWLVAHGDIDADKQIDTAKLFAPQYFK
jgi:ABC-type nitrate/sulfonate/bicarbonate transport system substrate-binding protein